MGRKCTNFVSRSTTTHIASCPCGDRGSPVTKSIVTWLHFHSEIDKGTSNPGGFLCSALTCWHIKKLCMKLAISFFIPSHQKFVRRSWYIFVAPWMYRVGGVMSFCHNFLRKSCILWYTHTVSNFHHSLITGEALSFSVSDLLQDPLYSIIPLLCLFDLFIQVILNANLVHSALCIPSSFIRTSNCIPYNSFSSHGCWVINTANDPNCKIT